MHRTKISILFSVWCIVCLPPILGAQSQSPEFQLRLLSHAQIVGKKNDVGIALWGILPNVMATDPFRALLLGGVVFKSEQRWLEVMGGLVITTHGEKEFEMDVRAVERSLGWAEVFAEVEYNFPQRRTYLSPIITTPAQLFCFDLKVGIELDVFLWPEMSNIFIGPRVGFALPFTRQLVLTTAYKIQQNGRPILKQYVLFNI